MKVFKSIGKTYNRINNLFAAIGVACVVFMVVSITIDVCGRYFFNSPIIWGVEINEYMVLYMTFLSAAWVLKQEGHVSVELVTSKLRERPRNIVLLVNALIGILICLIVTYYGIKLTYNDAVFGMFKPTVLRIPNVYILWVIPLGTLMLAIGFIQKSYLLTQKLKGVKAKEPAALEEVSIGGTNIG